ncbi:MAG: S46 family peptidase [Terriglobia bacterium]
MAILLFVLLATGLPGGAEEGMWTFDNPPVKQLQEKYGFTPTQAWLDHVRLSSVRFNDGGSGSFVSPHGLALTNHHVALTQLQKLSTAQKDYVKDGFYARTPAEEPKCPDLELNVLVSLEDVTARVQGAAKKGMSAESALQARKAEIAHIEKESTDKTGLRSDVVTLYDGGEYWLYRYKKYTDVRLVFAPEQQIAFFGGDPDNFTYPRYDFDMALFRVYENDKPLDSSNYLRWSARGAGDGELVFISGHPGSTDRLTTVSGLELQRDELLPRTLQTRKRRLDALRKYAAQGTEQERQASRSMFYLENAIKAFTGELEGLRDKALMEKKQKEEAEFRKLVNTKPEWKTAYGPAWDEMAGAMRRYVEGMKAFRYRRMLGSRAAEMALQIVQLVAEVKKPDGVRLEGFHESQLESLRFALFSSAPIYPGMEEVLIANTLQEAVDELGPSDPYVKTVLGGRTAAEVAKAAMSGTRIADPEFRKSLVEGGEAAVAASDDPLIALARKVDPYLRESQKWYEDKVQSAEVAAGEKIGKARFAVYGKSAYPDATFTLRLTYGQVKGYPMNGTQAPPWTTFYGLYDRAYSFSLKFPYELPARYLERKAALDLATPLNFVSVCDITGGNSGSPVINRNAELVGLVFDGNIESLPGTYVYSEEKNRAVAVHSAGIIEALRKLYDAGSLADELEGK